VAGDKTFFYTTLPALLSLVMDTSAAGVGWVEAALRFLVVGKRMSSSCLLSPHFSLSFLPPPQVFSSAIIDIIILPDG